MGTGMTQVSALHSQYKGKHVLITGGLGFLGSNLANSLIPFQPARLMLLDAMLPLYGGNYFNIEHIKHETQIVIADIRDRDQLDRILPGIDIIFHFAAQTSHIDSMRDPFLDADVNCRGTLTFLEAVKEKSPHARIVYAGTRSQYGIAQYSPVDERHPLNPMDIYSVHKQAGEWYHLMYHTRYGIPVTCLRLANTFGIRHQMKHGRYGILNWFIRLAIDNEDIPIYGDGSQLRNYTYVGDITSALISAGVSETVTGKAYNVGNEDTFSLLQGAEMIIAIVGRGRIKFLPWPVEWEKIEVHDFSISSQRFFTDTGWRPEVSLEEGLKKTVEFYQKNRTHYW